MSTIPYCYAGTNESFITVPVLKRFLKDAEESNNFDRKELINKLEEYASASHDQKQEVLTWLDAVLKEGILEMQVFLYELDEISSLKVRNDNLLDQLESRIASKGNRHVCGNSYSGEYELVNYTSRIGDHGEVLSITLCRLLYVANNKGETYKLIYPVFIDIYKDKNLLTVRAKSKSNLFDYSDDDFKIETAQSTNVDREIRIAKSILEKWIGVNFSLEDSGLTSLRSKLYMLLEKYTQTPIEITTLMNDKRSLINTLSSSITSDICRLTSQYNEDVQSDINNLVEKYFSISYTDKSIFTKDRDAYPLKIIATDDEDSKVEQTAALEEPLQSKAVFFDNKKMMQKSGICDGIWFRYLRKDSKYFGKQFNLRMQAKANRFVIKFTEFTMEEDILHVLFSLISA